MLALLCLQVSSKVCKSLRLVLGLAVRLGGDLGVGAVLLLQGVLLVWRLAENFLAPTKTWEGR